MTTRSSSFDSAFAAPLIRGFAKVVTDRGGEFADQFTDRIRVGQVARSLKGGGELGGGHHLHRLGDALDGGDGLDKLPGLSDLCHGWREVGIRAVRPPSGPVKDGVRARSQNEPSWPGSFRAAFAGEAPMRRIMAHVDEVRPSGSKVSAADTLIERHVGRVSPISQQVEHQRLELGGSQDPGGTEETSVPSKARSPAESAAARPRRDGVDFDAQDRQSPCRGVAAGPESVEKHRPQAHDVERSATNRSLALSDVRRCAGRSGAAPRLPARRARDRGSHQGVVPTDLVETVDVIDVRVGDEDAVTSIETMSEGLLPMIGRNVDEEDPGMSLGIGETDRGTATQSTTRDPRHAGWTQSDDEDSEDAGTRKMNSTS